MLPSARTAVRFSDKFLISGEADGRTWLSFRLVRLLPQMLRDAELSVWCGIVDRDEEGAIVSCNEYALPLETSRISTLETWCARHCIDRQSPLHDNRVKDLAFVNVTLSVYDTAHMQEARIYHSYHPFRDMVCDARFESMKTWTAAHSTRKLTGLEMTSRVCGGFLGNRSTSGSSTDLSSIRELHHVVDMSKLDRYAKVEAAAEGGK